MVQVLIPDSGAPVDPGSFAVQQDTCSGRALEVGQTCSLAVTFKPRSAGTKSATLSLQGTGFDIAGNVFLFGAGSTISVTPSSGAFGAVSVGSTSPPITFTVTAGPGATGALRTLSSNASPFALSKDTCSGLAMTPGVQCTFDVTFSPSSAAMAGGAVLISSTDGSLIGPDLLGTGS
jgi:hypothetical protein